MSSANSAARIARMLNSTREFGLGDGEVLGVFEDYFSASYEENVTNIEEEESTDGFLLDDDEEETLQQSIHEVVGCVADSFLERAEDTILDDVETGVRHAAEIAEETIDFVTVKERKNHCRCQLFLNPDTKNKERCINQFTELEQDEIRMNVHEMTPYEKNLLLLGMVCASINDAETTLCSKQKGQQERQNTRMRWFYMGHKRVCRDTFMYLMETCKDTITKIKKHYEQFGLTPRTKISGGLKNNKHALSLDDVKKMVQFVLNFCQEHAIILPGRIPGFARSDITVLPSEFTKADVWRRYKESALQANERAMGISTFRKLWLKLIPYVVIAKPACDLCWTCQQNNHLIIKKVNVDEEEKSAALRRQEKHLYEATTERSLYRSMCLDSKNVAINYQMSHLGPSEPCSRPISFHYSFDYAQQIHYPCDPMQPGPIYFKTPRKCQIFGLHAEGLSQQINYLVDEASFCGKGANAVISMIHHFFENYAVGECEVHLNADNCSGQNKNNCMIQYLCWRTLIGLHDKCSIHFLLTGHTKFAPDWCFGLLKKRYRVVRVSSLKDVCNVVETSTEKGINRVQLVGDQQGNTIVTTFDWTTFLGQFFRRFIGIKSYHHFRFDKDEPGLLHYKELSESEEADFNLLKALPPHNARPQVTAPKGLDLARQIYLFREIREFCTPETKDSTCPRPDGYELPETEKCGDNVDNRYMSKRAASFVTSTTVEKRNKTNQQNKVNVAKINED